MVKASTFRYPIPLRNMQRLRELGCPTHIIAGEKDSAVPVPHAEMLHRHIADSTLRVISEAGHTLAWTHSAQLAAEIVSRGSS
jgi:pimeloyl-ACP methyl ester carboxylesterase